jgi:hypothetical protein
MVQTQWVGGGRAPQRFAYQERDGSFRILDSAIVTGGPDDNVVCELRRSYANAHSAQALVDALNLWAALQQQQVINERLAKAEHAARSARLAKRKKLPRHAWSRWVPSTKMRRTGIGAILFVVALALVGCTKSKTPHKQFVERLHTCGPYIPNHTAAGYSRMSYVPRSWVLRAGDEQRRIELG